MLAGYALLRNRCATPQSVRSVASQDFAATTMHETLVENGVSRMREVAAVTIPAGGIATFQPGGRHLMLMRPKRALHTGDRVVLRFKLVDGREVRADFVIREQAPK
ncbi:hypothetical protein N789_05385 [Arenimonas oryziterrae DSM 21050 = YC6267]|uniref:Copper chaperone PCu(A)C n=2 Tax=Arenimonas TaxID=490567 RepID=A0A091BA34_9GAMM|nr:hypothetical protein N789_05385 [Arenimonas oryziterrae DSM 21050 = YC6267]